MKGLIFNRNFWKYLTRTTFLNIINLFFIITFNMKPNQPEQMTESELTPARQVAEDFISQFTDEDIYSIQTMQPETIKEYLTQIAENNLEYAIHIKPGRPSRPAKPPIG